MEDTSESTPLLSSVGKPSNQTRATKQQGACQVLNRLIYNIGTIKHRVAYQVCCGGLAWSICKLMGYVNCELLGAAVFFSMGLLFTATAEYVDTMWDSDQVKSGRLI